MGDPKADTETYRTVTFDISTLTLDEGIKAELASGLSIQEIARSKAAMRVLALFVHNLRSKSDGPTPSWSELSSLRLLDVWPSTSASTSGGRSKASKG